MRQAHHRVRGNRPAPKPGDGWLSGPAGPSSSGALSWAVARRLDYIDWRLSTIGDAQRADLVRVFGVSMSQASADIAAFERAHPGAMNYDMTAKRYVPARPAYRSQRGMDDPNVRRAISLLAAAGHPMGWAE